jgi:hypothetical protein
MMQFWWMGVGGGLEDGFVETDFGVKCFRLMTLKAKGGTQERYISLLEIDTP